MLGHGTTQVSSSATFTTMSVNIKLYSDYSCVFLYSCIISLSYKMKLIVKSKHVISGNQI